MLIGAVVALMLAILMSAPLSWHRSSRQAYLASGLGIYGGMITVYWAAQHIPSGWISVIFGISPIVTALMARLWLQESEPVTRPRLIGMLMGVAGLLVMFATSLNLNSDAALGILVMLVSVSIHCASAVWIKRINPDLAAISQTSGSLLVAAPLFLITWLLAGETIPTTMTARSIGAITYLALLGSVVGFALYYYVLSKVDATRVALLTLVTPVCALALGHSLNQEPINADIIIGALLILSGLATFESGGTTARIRARFLRY